jgi:arylsulfatase A-like enzyme
LEEKVGSWLAAEAAGLQREKDRTRLFVFIHMWDVHYDYLAPQKYLEIFDPDYSGDLDGNGISDNPQIHEGMPEDDLDHLKALYDAEIRYTDETLGRLLTLFEKHGRLRKSAVIVTADHGEEFFDQGNFGHGTSLEEEVLRVPLIMWVPGIEPARREVNDVVSIIDIAPTICDLLGIPCAGRGAGQSLWGFYTDQRSPTHRGDALAEVTKPFLKLNLTSLISATGKVTRWNMSERLAYSPANLDSTEQIWLEKTEMERYSTEIRSTYSELEQRAAKAHREGKAVRERQSEPSPDIDPETRRQLEALGYLEEAKQ